MSVSAPVACGTCKRQKKRCDKRLPSCSRCIFVLSKCVYGNSNQDSVRTVYKVHDAANSAIQLQWPEGGYNSIHSSYIRNDIQELHAATVSYVCGIAASNGETIHNIATYYFKSVGPWLPAISRKRLYQDLTIISSLPRADIALLILSMRLVCQEPFHEKGPMVIRNSIYFKTKELFGLLQSADILTKELIQAGLLITIYEYGHGLSQQAFLTVGACMRMALALSWHNMEESLVPLALEEERRTLWAIYIFDQLIYLDRDPSSTMPTPESMIPNIKLPTDDETWDRAADMLELVDPYQGTARYQAEVVQLLGRVISHVARPCPNPETKKQQEQDISDKLIALALHIAEHSGNKWGANCGALGIAYVGLMLLHQQNINGKSETAISNPLQPSVFELRRTIRIIVDIANILNPCFNGYDFLPVPPLTCYATYQAAFLHIQMAKDMHDSEWDTEFQALKAMMIGFRRRWSLSGKYLCMIQEVYDKKLLASRILPSTDIRAQWRSSVGIGL